VTGATANKKVSATGRGKSCWRTSHPRGTLKWSKRVGSAEMPAGRPLEFNRRAVELAREGRTPVAQGRQGFRCFGVGFTSLDGSG
jgi:hypothetical protein